MENKVLAVTYKDLRDLFRSRAFCNVLTKAADEAFKHGEENHFAVARKYYEKGFLIGNILYNKDLLDDPGSSVGVRYLESVVGAKETPENRPNGILLHEVFPVVNYHTHTTPNNSHPSPEDLFCMASARTVSKNRDNFNNKPLFTIGSFRKCDKNLLDILVLQERLSKPMGEAGLDILNGVSEVLYESSAGNEKIAKALAGTGMVNAAVLNYSRNKTHFLPDKDSLTKLEQFAYQP